MTAKERHTLKLLEYLGDPANDWPIRGDYAVIILGLSDPKLLYKCYTPADLTALEAEALTLRRTKYAGQFGKIDKALMDAAEGGDTQAIKLAYQRFEAWSEKMNIAHTGKDGGPIQHTVDYMTQAKTGLDALASMREARQSRIPEDTTKDDD